MRAPVTFLRIPPLPRMAQGPRLRWTLPLPLAASSPGSSSPAALRLFVSWLVYSDWKHLFLVSSDGGAPQKLTPDGGIPIAPTWSSDGKSIAFSYFPFPDKLLRIELVDLASRQISAMPRGEGYYYPSWSPDGKYL